MARHRSRKPSPPRGPEQAQRPVSRKILLLAATAFVLLGFALYGGAIALNLSNAAQVAAASRDQAASPRLEGRDNTATDPGFPIRNGDAKDGL